MDYHHPNSELLWLALGALAMLEPFPRPREILPSLQGREKAYALARCEEIFFYLATLTPAGITLETAARRS